MSPIEHAWNELNRRVRQNDINNVNDPEWALITEWKAIPQTFFEKLYNSMSADVKLVLLLLGDTHHFNFNYGYDFMTVSGYFFYTWGCLGAGSELLHV